MPVFNVHIYPTVRVKVSQVEAANAIEAGKKIDVELNLHAVLDGHCPPHGVDTIEWDEGQTKVALIDPLLPNGEIDYANSTYLDLVAGTELVGGKTEEELQLQQAVDAKLFMAEVLDFTETLRGLAEEYGTATLADLAYLQSAILSGSFIDSLGFGESRIVEFVKTLPSADRWMEFIRIEDEEEADAVSRHRQGAE